MSIQFLTLRASALVVALDFSGNKKNHVEYQEAISVIFLLGFILLRYMEYYRKISFLAKICIEDETPRKINIKKTLCHFDTENEENF